MTLLDLFNALLKVGSLSGLAAFSWQLLRAWDEHRARLKVVAHRGLGDTVNLRVSYRPKFEHQGLYARATIMRPPNARLAAMEHARPFEDLARAIQRTAKRLELERSVELCLLQADGGADGIYSGELLVAGLGHDPSARLRLEVGSRGRRCWLARRHLSVTPMD